MMNKNLLKSKMALYGDNFTTLAEAIGLTLQTLSLKINENKAEFTQSEIKLIKERYHLTNDEVDEIFFADAVSFEETKVIANE